MLIEIIAHNTSNQTVNSLIDMISALDKKTISIKDLYTNFTDKLLNAQNRQDFLDLLNGDLLPVKGGVTLVQVSKDAENLFATLSQYGKEATKVNAEAPTKDISQSREELNREYQLLQTIKKLQEENEQLKATLENNSLTESTPKL